MKPASRPALILIGFLAALVLTVLSFSAVFAALVFLGHGRADPGLRAGPSCLARSFAGSVVNVTATDMGRPMMGGPGRRMGGMRLTADRSSVAHGSISFLVTNAGRFPHELVILPLSGTQTAGSRTAGGDGRIDEAGSLGEASATCAEGAGQGILPGSAGWVSVNLPPGRYELLCNFPGHYVAGMYTQITVT